MNLERDPLHSFSPPGILWSRVNTVEAAPGVVDALTWTFMGHLAEVGGRQGFADFGVIPQSEVRMADDVGERMLGIFHGRYTLNVSVVRGIMSGLPGVSGDDVERDLLGVVRSGVVDHVSYGWRLPHVLYKMPVTAIGDSRQSAAMLAEFKRRWAQTVGAEGVRDGFDPYALLQESMDRFMRVITVQGHGRLLFQAISTALTDLAERAGDASLGATLQAGTVGLEETAVADDLFEVANERLKLSTFIERHGFHGPNAGLVANRSWREDPAPVERLLTAARGTQPPRERRAEAQAARGMAVEQLLAGLPRKRRPAAKLLLRLGPSGARSLERSKIGHLMMLDMARGAARGIGEDLVASGRLDDVEDVFLFEGEELVALPEGDLRRYADQRRLWRDEHRATDIPETWEGQPVPIPPGESEESDVRTVTGLGVSHGVIEGVARLVTDPGDAGEVEPGDILVCTTTDPSWVGLMTVAGALVIDIGGTASHGAIVARELAVPCVIGTRTGTKDLRDGDRLRVDGSRGEVAVLERA